MRMSKNFSILFFKKAFKTVLTEDKENHPLT